MKKVVPNDAILIPKDAELVFSGKIFDVYQWQQELFNGSSDTFEMLKRADTATAIAIVGDKILVLDDEQPNRGVKKSFPGGRIDEEDQDLEGAAKREVLEETGYSFNNWKLLKIWQPSGKIEWFVSVWLAWGSSSKVEPSLDPGEKITVHELSFSEVKEMVMNNVGVLGEAQDIFKNLDSIEGLLGLPEFEGKPYET